ncbi:hypothetical protein NL676_021519 [Syzygium grande]|nr:hypothetical protein NL676_021519 [Syzygium grande]
MVLGGELAFGQVLQQQDSLGWHRIATRTADDHKFGREGGSGDKRQRWARRGNWHGAAALYSYGCQGHCMAQISSGGDGESIGRRRGNVGAGTSVVTSLALTGA